MTNHRQQNYFWRQRGDTIVEVIIAVAVISAILAGAFALTNRSSRAVRDAEEHAQALQLLQGQVELLRYAASKTSLLPSDLSTPFCLSTSAYYQPASSNTQCKLNSSNISGQSDSIYSVSIVKSALASGGATTTFDLTASWPALGSGLDTVYLSYKVDLAP
jgi:type II secretory pathway pseudopilin PulG